MAQGPAPTPVKPLSSGAATRELARRSRRRRLRRAILLGILLAVVATGSALLLTGKAVLPVVSDKIYPIRYREDIAAAAQQYKVDPYLVAAVTKAESGYDPLAVSSAGAVGLMQLMPDTADWVAGLKSWKGRSKPQLTNPSDNIQLGTCYLAYLADNFGGDSTAVLAAYNAGEGTVRDWIQSVGGAKAFDESDIRFPETRAFVQKVRKYEDLYQRIYPNGVASAGSVA